MSLIFILLGTFFLLAFLGVPIAVSLVSLPVWACWRVMFS